MEDQNVMIEDTVKCIVSLLVEEGYERLEKLSGSVRLKAGEIETGVAEYGRRLVPPPDAAFEKIDAIPLLGVDPAQYSIRFRLFTEEEGESDLEIQMTLVDQPNKEIDGIMSVEIDNILVA